MVDTETIIGGIGLLLIAWGIIMALYLRFWPIPAALAVAYAGRWVAVLVCLIALAMALITVAHVPAHAALAFGIVIFVPSGIAVKWLPVCITV